MFLFFLYTCSDWYRLCFRNCVVWMGSRWCNRITFIPSQLEGVQTFLLGLVQISSYGWQNIITVFREWYVKLSSLSSAWRESVSFVYLSILKFSVSAHHITDKNLHSWSISVLTISTPSKTGWIFSRKNYLVLVICIDVDIVSFSLLFFSYYYFFKFTICA